jgi:hypothetical protein
MSNPFNKNSRSFIPHSEPQIKNELKKLFDVKNIFQVRHSDSVENLVLVRKKNREIRLCVDFKNLNKASKKDNCVVPPMDQILQLVSRLEMLSLLDGFLGYNQVLVVEEDILKTTFKIKWGKFEYKRMPFSLINARASFQRAMDTYFHALIGKNFVVYLDGITVYSKNKKDHFQHLTQIFERCMKYGISLNPKKRNFTITKDKLLGHIISKEGITIDPKRVKKISQVNLPHNKKVMQLFFGKVNCVRKIILDFAKTVKQLQEMIKKYFVFKWTQVEKDVFDKIKDVIANAPVLHNPNFDEFVGTYTEANSGK